MYNETLRHNSHRSHEGPTAKTKVPSPKHERAAPKSHRLENSPLVLQPIMTVSRSSTHTSPASRRANHRRDAFEGCV
ncbi:hypothetical protein C8Q75DRAFT_750272 [Abortiporus biennis]|nr:hypothetical protein C8Q75DRAFT_750272 [Abortiporus biennis]